ncbi:MAG: histidinol-phosphate aminotransferase family protein [Verrucomicrobiales bacterium]|nr:histidinol-phosphate aminotransferase family protein [Verrucomicrobiales bacterium]
MSAETAEGLDNHGNADGGPSTSRWVVRMATDADREAIYRIRHEVYARELGQHAVNSAQRLTDFLDAYNRYIVISDGTTLLGFVSITPAGSPKFSVDKYLAREVLPFPVDDRLFEVRILTVPATHRRSLLALALMYASFRWVEARGGTRIMAIGRQDLLPMYGRVGLKPCGQVIRSGAVTYELMTTTMPEVHAALVAIRPMLDRINQEMTWEIGVEFHTPATCYHGGSFFEAVGEEFNDLNRLDTVVNADVLDAWFPPAPGVIESIQRHLPQILRTSPPTGCEGLIRAIGRARGIRPDCVLPGAGSSDLIFLALRHWLNRDSRVLLLDPTYGEYSHILERVIRCNVDRLTLDRASDYRVELPHLEWCLNQGYDLVLLVNPNNPAGQHIPRHELEPLLRRTPIETRVWIDEAYVEYAGDGESLEPVAADTDNVVVCKSMSKTYALSGARVAYLCAASQQLEALRGLTPPWAVSLPAQIAAVRALQDPAYYAARYAETRALRESLATGLRALGWSTLPGVTNFVLCHLPPEGPDAESVVRACRARDVFLRNPATMGTRMGTHAIRVAVKDAATNHRTLGVIDDAYTSLKKSS